VFVVSFQTNYEINFIPVSEPHFTDSLLQSSVCERAGYCQLDVHSLWHTFDNLIRKVMKVW